LIRIWLDEIKYLKNHTARWKFVQNVLIAKAGDTCHPSPVKIDHLKPELVP